MHKIIMTGDVISAYGAKFLAENNEVTLIEEHKPENRPVHCAGLISKSGFKRLKINPDKFILNKIKEQNFSRKTMLMKSEQTKQRRMSLTERCLIIIFLTRRLTAV